MTYTYEEYVERSRTEFDNIVNRFIGIALARSTKEKQSIKADIERAIEALQAALRNIDDPAQYDDCN